MRVFVIGAGQVGTTVVEALHREHEVTVVDVDPSRLSGLAQRFDVATLEANGASRRALQDAGIQRADLVIACTSRDEVNVIAALFAKKLAPEARTVVRTMDVEYLEVWRERQLDVDFIVSTELETAFAVSRHIGVPAARQTDVFADGQVQIVEFDVDAAAPGGDTVGRTLREAHIPADSKVAAIIRGDELRRPGGDESILPGDRIVVIGSPAAAQDWSAIVAPAKQRAGDVVVFGGGRYGTAIARVLLDQSIRVRIVESRPERAAEVSTRLAGARVYHASALDAEFLERERIGQVTACVFALGDDARNLYAAALATVHGVAFTIAVVEERVPAGVFERVGLDVVVDPRSLTAEEIVRFARDPRTQQVAMLESDRYEILDITVRPESRLANTRFRDLPMTGALIGAIVRDGQAIFPHGDDVLLPGDRAIIFTESARIGAVEQAL